MATRSRKADCFVWTDDEVELLLKITHEYKSSKAAENTDWESCQSKYSDILQRYKEHYPSREEAQTLAKDYPHSLEDISKVIISTKLKAVRLKYRQALDSGRRRGHGRVILLYFELCEEIWGGSPATQTIPHGIESGDMRGQTEDSLSTSASPGSSITDAEKDPAAEVERGRDRFGATLYGYKKDKLKRKLSSDLSLAQEDLNIKRKLLHRLEVTDKEFADTMGKISSTMDRLTHNIEKLTTYIVDTADVRQHLAPPHPPPQQSHLCVPVESRKQVPPPAVRENTEQTMPSLPAMHSASAQVTIKKEETQGESWVEEACEDKGMVKVLEGNGPQSPMLEVPQQPDGLLHTYKEQVNQLQQELEEMKRRCEHLQEKEMEYEMLQRRMEDMVMENSSLSYQCEELNRELEQLRTNGGTGMPSPGEEAQNNVNISSQEDTCRKLRNLRQSIGRLLVTFVPTLDLEEINLDSDVMDKTLDEVLNEITEV